MADDPFVRLDVAGARYSVIAFGGTLEPETLVSAYRAGVFPWPSGEDDRSMDRQARSLVRRGRVPLLPGVDGLVPWCSPDPRAVLLADQVVLRRSLRQRLRTSGWTTTVDAAFDDVVASLVLHYLRDWGPTLAELHRVLVPGGRLIASVEHPFVLALTRRLAGEKANYFGVTERTEEWTTDRGSTRLTFWDRPLHAMTDAFTAAGFRIEVISEPPAVPGAPEMFPEEFAPLSDTRFLGFLFFVLQAD